MGERPFFEQLHEALVVKSAIHNLKESSLHVRLLTVADGFQKQVPERLLLKGFSEDIEDTRTQGGPFLFELL